MTIAATYISASSFSVAGDQTVEFHTGRRVKMVGDSNWFGTILTATYSSVTTVTLTSASDDIDSSLAGVLYGVISAKEDDCSMPIHTHDGDEGSGGVILAADVPITDAGSIITADNVEDALQENRIAIDLNTAKISFDSTSSTKLGTIEEGADVTDATNVNAAGAVMESDTSTSNMSFVLDEDDMNSDSDTKIPTQQSVKAYAMGVEDYIMSAGRINNPLVHLPLKNGFNMPYGTGSVSFARSTTATYIDRYGVVQHAAADEPRFEKEGLLIEGSSTNLCLHSEDFSTGWGVSKSTIDSTSELAPDGNNTGCKVTITDVGGCISSEVSPSLNVGDWYTVSAWIKGDGTSGAIIGFYEVWNNTIPHFSDEFTPTTEWQRYSFSAQIEDASNTIINIQPVRSNDIGGVFYVWGAQLEPLPFASSYNPTTTAAVTRTPDVCSLTYAGNMPDETVGADRTLLIDFSFLGQHNSMQTIFYSNYAGDYLVRYPTDTVGIVKSRINSNLLYSSVFAAFDGTKYRGGLVSDGVKSLYYINGSLEDSANIVYRDIQTQVELRLGVNASSDQLFGHLSNFRIWDEALTEQEMRIA